MRILDDDDPVQRIVMAVDLQDMLRLGLNICDRAGTDEVAEPLSKLERSRPAR